MSNNNNITVTYSSREGWLAGRRNYLGSSDVATVLGHGYASQSPYTVWASKVHGVEEEISEATKDLFFLGNTAERLTLDLFAHYEKQEVFRDKLLTIRSQEEWPFLGVTVDAWLRNPMRVVEAKFVGIGAKAEWAEGALPLKHQIQVQSQLAATGWESGYLVGWDGQRAPMIRAVPRNDDFIEIMTQRLSEWWTTHVLGKQEPPADDRKATASVLQLLHPCDNGKTVVIPEDLLDWIDKRKTYKSQIKELDLVCQQTENRIKAELGANTFGLLPDGRAVSWKHLERASYTVKATTYRRLTFHEHLPDTATPPEYKDLEDAKSSSNDQSTTDDG